MSENVEKNFQAIVNITLKDFIGEALFIAKPEYKLFKKLVRKIIKNSGNTMDTEKVMYYLKPYYNKQDNVYIIENEFTTDS